MSQYEEENLNGDDAAATLLPGDYDNPDSTCAVVSIPLSSKKGLRAALAVLSMATTGMWVALLTADAVAPYKGVSSYRTRDSCVDVAALEFVASLVFFAAAFMTTDGAFLAVQFGEAWLGICLFSKFWMYRGWHRHASIADSIGFSISVAMMVFRWSLVRRLAQRETDAKSKLQWSSTKRILRPYFYPNGLRNKLFVVLTWGALLAGKSCEIIAPIILGQIVNNLAAQPPDGSLGLIAVYIALNMAPRILSEVQDSLYVKVTQTAFTEVAEVTFRHIHSLSLEWHLKKKLGNVTRYIDRGQEAADTLMYSLVVYLMPAAGTAIASFIVFAEHFQQPEVAAVCFLGFGTYCWVTIIVMIWRQKFRQEMNKSDNEMHDKASDSLINFETVKYFTNEEYETQEYIRCVRDYQQGGFRTQVAISALNVSQSATIQLSMLGSLMLVAWAVASGNGGSAGVFVSIQQYVWTIFEPLSALGMIYNSVIGALVDLENLSELLAEVPDIADRADAAPLQRGPKNDQKEERRVVFSPSASQAVTSPLPPAASVVGAVDIEFRDVSFHYPTQSAAHGLQAVSFKVPAGTTTAIVGETGSGKTTLSRLLFRFYDVLSGSILVNGQDLRAVTQQSLRKAIGIVPQDTVMFNNSIAYNIRYGNLDASDSDVTEAARKAQVHRFIESLTEQYETVVGERGLKLSGGEKQRVAIARCLLKDPPVVLLDEATSALDNKTERELQSALLALKGRTTLIIAHRLTTVAHADQIIVMKAGRVAERGTHAALLAKGEGGHYYDMWHAQRIDRQETPDTGTPTSTSPAADAEKE